MRNKIYPKQVKFQSFELFFGCCWRGLEVGWEAAEKDEGANELDGGLELQQGS
jgi:hypothetical protein